MNAELLVRMARTYCARQLPWFAPALFQCQLHFTDQVPVAAIDEHFNVYFNPEAIRTICAVGEVDEHLARIGFIWIHEISHLLREHSDRARERSAEARLWNVAADMEINDADWDGLEMPDVFPGMIPKDYDLPAGQIAEYYYGVFADPDSGKLEELLDVAEDGSSPDLPDEGSGAHGVSRSWEVSEEDGGQQLDEMELELVRRSVAVEMKNHEGQGKLPGQWERWAEDKLKPKVNWRRILRHRMSVALNKGVGSRVDYSFRRPSRRQAVFNPILPPSLNGDRSVRIAVVVDTSGSMSPGQLSQAVAEVCEVLQIFRVPVSIIPCDARAYEPIRVATPSDYFKLENLQGGGGTNMIVGIEAALELKPKPDTVLVLTDGYTPFPPRLYKTPVLFGIFTFPGQTHVPRPPNPPWRGDLVVEILVEGR